MDEHTSPGNDHCTSPNKRRSAGEGLSKLLIILLAVCVGILLGMIYATSRTRQRTTSIIYDGSNKINGLLQLISDRYVDTVDVSQLIEDALPTILSELDPHSRYISAADIEDETEALRGNFGGIGISFSMQADTVNVMSLIPTGPAEAVGLMPGDRIVKADTVNLVGMRDIDVMKHLKGEVGTSVLVTVVRRGQAQPLTFDIQRDIIPIVSVDASYIMPDDATGYIRVKNFGEHTYAEMLNALVRLQKRGMTRLIVDLRGNTGGYMQTAILMANEFLPRGQLIVYTEGTHSPREDVYSDGFGSFQYLPLVVLIDEGSASSSEIFAGAIQDNDRGLILGRRSFGKGLVQQQVEFSDGSSVRLTVSRYYTPSGRCIQKAYEKGHSEEYENELLTRYERGEYFSPDSIRFDGPAYRTAIGRTVYGGGGIMPDIFIPEDTTLITSYYKEAVFSGLIRQFAFEYTDNNRATLTRYADAGLLPKYLETQNLVEQFARYAQQHGLPRRNLLMKKSRPLFERYILGGIIYNATDTQRYVEYTNQSDTVVLRAQEILQSGEWKPKRENAVHEAAAE